MELSSSCPCCSGRSYGECCYNVHHGEAARNPEALMRSRYSAFAIEDADYLSATWHSQTRPQNLSLEPDTHWLRLEIVDSSERGDDGEVTFIATFREKQEWLRLSETSRFIRENGRWYYLDGNASFETFKPGRNGPCPCGSGQKFKKCCG